MEYLDGITLKEYLGQVGTIPEDEAINMLMPVMESLQTVHAEGLLHRDIAPDNIFLTKDGSVKLIDFGASRYATTSHSRSLTVIIKPGYSPEEQYRSRGRSGSVYRCLCHSGNALQDDNRQNTSGRYGTQGKIREPEQGYSY